MLRYFILGGGALAVLLSVLIFAKPEILGRSSTPQGEVKVWGTLPEESMGAIIQQFNAQAKTYTVSYRYVSEANFGQRLLEALASNAGPDLIMAPYQTILSQSGRIMPLSVGEKTFKDTYVDGASIFYAGGSTLALPVAMEPMVLFYNRALFSKHGIINPPSTWNDIVTITPSLTVRQNGAFVESAIALGTPDVPYIKDIIMTMVMQLGQSPLLKIVGADGKEYYDVRMNSPVNEGGEVLPLSSVLRYVSQFGDAGITTYTWSQNEVPASDKFLAEKLAMYIGYSGELASLRARNPHGEFEMTALPQSYGANTFVTGMRMYGIATLRTSRNPSVAQVVASQWGGGGVSPAIASIVGGVPALRLYAGTQGLDQSIARTMLVARGWYDSYSNETTAYTKAMIFDVINYRQGVSDAASTFVSRVRDLYAKE